MIKSSFIFFVSSLLVARSLEKESFSYTLSPKTLQNGQAALLSFEPPLDSIKYEVKLEQAAIPVFECKIKKRKWCAFIAMPFDTPPGTQKITISWKEKEETKSKILEIKIKKGKFPITRLKVNPDKVTPTEEEKKRIEEEKKELEALYAHLESGPLWKSPFQLPVKTGVTSRYGGQRVFNGQLKSVHFGVDLKAAKGDPVYSMNDGKVILAKNFFYAGNLVVIDHGQGLVSSYAHLNEIKVGAGSVVKKGELLGKAGATGRVTGPHLHWAMRVNAVSVDPLQATKMVNSFAVLKGEP